MHVLGLVCTRFQNGFDFTFNVDCFGSAPPGPRACLATGGGGASASVDDARPLDLNGRPATVAPGTAYVWGHAVGAGGALPHRLQARWWLDPDPRLRPRRGRPCRGPWRRPRNCSPPRGLKPHVRDSDCGRVWGPRPRFGGPQPRSWGPQPRFWGRQPQSWGPQPLLGDHPDHVGHAPAPLGFLLYGQSRRLACIASWGLGAMVAVRRCALHKRRSLAALR